MNRRIPSLLRRGGREAAGGGVTALIDLTADGTFTRSTAGTYQTGASTLALAAVDARRFENRGDASGLLVEQAHQNELTAARDLTGLGWVNTAGVTTNAIAGPDGASLADRQTLASGVLGCYQGDTIAALFTFWVRSVSGTQTIQLWVGGSNASYNSVSVGEDWTRVQSNFVPNSPINAVPSDGRLSAPKGHTAMAQDFYLDFMSYDATVYYPLSCIDTTTLPVAVAADVLTFASGTWDAALASGSASYTFRPLWAASDLSSGNVRWLWSVGGSSNGVRARHNGTSVVFEMLSGGSTVATSPVTTHARHDEIELLVDAATGQLTLNGTPGTVGTAPTWSTASIARLGGIQGGVSEVDARIVSVLAT